MVHFWRKPNHEKPAPKKTTFYTNGSKARPYENNFAKQSYHESYTEKTNDFS